MPKHTRAAAKRKAAEQEPPAQTYDEKLAEVRRDLDTLVAKLRTHGIHVSLDPQTDDDEEAQAVGNSNYEA
jgi:hypothetical protein